MSRSTLPAAIASSNVHRVILQRADLSDFDRIEDIVADGLAALRGAIAALDDLPADLVVPLGAAERALREVTAKRRLLAEATRAAIERWLDEAERKAGPLASDPAVQRIERSLGEALGASDRALDLLAAERDIGWHRGQGR